MTDKTTCFFTGDDLTQLIRDGELMSCWTLACEARFNELGRLTIDEATEVELEERRSLAARRREMEDWFKSKDAPPKRRFTITFTRTLEETCYRTVEVTDVDEARAIAIDMQFEGDLTADHVEDMSGEGWTWVDIDEDNE